jgi:surface antigen-like variable number repeat protein
VRRAISLLAACATSVAAESAITFRGELGLRPPEIRKALRSTRSRTMLPRIPGVWKGWRLQPDYSENAVQSDATALRALYYRHGYFDAAVAVKPATIRGGEAHIGFTVTPGTRYAIRQIDGRGNRTPRTEIPMAAVCRDLLDERRKAEQIGVLDFAAEFQLRDAVPLDSTDPRDWVEGTTNVRTAPAYRIRRIQFQGNHQFRDETLRRMLRIEEGAPLDSLRIRQSLARLNRTGWFEPLSPANVRVGAVPGSDLADVTIQLQETRPGFWSFSGPVGPLSAGGPLQFSAGTRLPGRGRGVLELSTFAVSANLMLFAKPMSALLPFLPDRRLIQVLALERPLLPGDPWLSGLTIAPQFGWPGLLAGYGVEHARGWVRSWSDSEDALTPGLPVTVTHNGSAGTMYCPPPRTKLDRARQFGAIAAGALLSFVPL